MEGTGTDGCKMKKREEGTGNLYIGPRGSIVAGVTAISPAEWGEVGRRERRDSKIESRPSRVRVREGERGSGRGEGGREQRHGRCGPGDAGARGGGAGWRWETGPTGGPHLSVTPRGGRRAAG
jgi:hypothetical protein